MDPNETLKELRAALTYRGLDDSDSEVRCKYMRASELCRALDEWLQRGGFLPKEWEENRK